MSFARLLDVLATAGITTCVLKGLAMTETHYVDRGVRAAADLDVLVKPDDAAPGDGGSGFRLVATRREVRLVWGRAEPRAHATHPRLPD